MIHQWRVTIATPHYKVQKQLESAPDLLAKSLRTSVYVSINQVPYLTAALQAPGCVVECTGTSECTARTYVRTPPPDAIAIRPLYVKLPVRVLFISSFCTNLSVYRRVWHSPLRTRSFRKFNDGFEVMGRR